MKNYKYCLIAIFIISIFLIPILFSKEIVINSLQHPYEELIELQDKIASDTMIIEMGVHSVWIDDKDNSIIVEYTGEYVKEIKKRIALMNDKSIEVNYVDSPPMKPLLN